MQIIFLDAPEAKQIVDKILEAKPIVLAGSGISTFKSLTGNDTCLPSGKEFTEDMFDYLLPPDFFGYNLYMIKILREQWQNVVFENLLESCPDYDKLRRIIKKSFIKAEPNQIHKCISDIFIKGDFSGLITTNYDQCFDNLLKNHDVERVVIKEDYDLVKQPFENWYFKIHGSIDDTDGKTLVFALYQEGFLKEWKREFLPKMIQTNSLFIVGYSGSDFEICPELLKLPIETVFWNLTGKNKEQFMNKLNFNTNEFLKKKDGYFLVGDMKVLFSSITNQPINLDKGESSKDFFKLIKDEASFTKMEIGIWRASILNTIGCASLAFKASEEVLAMFREKDNEASEEVLAISPEKDNEAKIRRQLAKSLYDLGKYNQSAKEYLSVSKHYVFDTTKQVPILSEASNSYKVYGNFLQFFLKNREINRISKGDKKANAWTMIRIWRLLYLVFEFIHFFPLRNYVERKIEELYPSTAKYLRENGNLFAFQQLKQWVERMGINPNIADDMSSYVPTSNKEGYSRLAYFVGNSMDIRDRLCSIDEFLSDDVKDEFKETLEYCNAFHLYPEVWKLCCINLKHNICMEKRKTIKLLCASFLKCEYSFFMITLCIFHAIFHLYKPNFHIFRRIATFWHNTSASISKYIHKL